MLNPLHRYTVLGVSTHGVSESEAFRAFLMAGVHHADRTCTVVAGERSCTGYLIVVGGNPFEAVDRLSDILVDFEYPTVQFHGYIDEYFSNPRGEPNKDCRVAIAQNMFDKFSDRAHAALRAITARQGA